MFELLFSRAAALVAAALFFARAVGQGNVKHQRIVLCVEACESDQPESATSWEGKRMQSIRSREQRFIAVGVGLVLVLLLTSFYLGMRYERAQWQQTQDAVQIAVRSVEAQLNGSHLR